MSQTNSLVEEIEDPDEQEAMREEMKKLFTPKSEQEELREWDKQNAGIERVNFSFFGAPYFKDPSYNPAPNNEETKILVRDFGFKYNLATTPFKKPCKFPPLKLSNHLRFNMLGFT